MPTATDLVTDLPADFEVFGQAVATSMADLLGGASGYILSKASATDMDFAWIANDQGDITGVTAGTGISGGGTSGTVTVTNSMATAIDAKGDLIAGTGADAFSRLAIGTNGTILTADSNEATGMKWAAAAAGGKVLQVVSANTTTQTANSTTTMADTTLTATITPTLNTSKVLVLVSQNGLHRSASNSNNAININLLRGATVISQIMSTGLYSDTALLLTGFSASANYLDSPATTSATTYKTQFSQRFASADVRVQQASDMSSIVLLEIGA
jgi:hypothetical protein